MRLEFAGAELPTGWALTPLDSVIPHDGVFADGDWVESKDQDPNGDVRLIQLADVGEGEFHNRSARFLTSEKATELRCTYLKKGDILIARMPDPLGRACVFPLDGDQRFVTVVDVCIVRTDQEQVDRTYLCHALNFLGVRKQIEDLQTGTTRKRISRSNLATVQIPLPPLNEQRNIAAKIDELFSELDTGIKILKEARAQLTTYRQAVLKHAFEGRLTTEWRANNIDRGVPAIAVLSRICQDREANHREQFRSWKVALHRWAREGRETERPSRPRNSVGGASRSPEEIGALPRLPDSWTWCRVEEVGQVQLGRQRSPKHTTGPYMRPYLRVANVFESRIDISDVYSMNFTPREFKVYGLKPSDILLNEGQSLELVGRPAMFNGEVSGCCFQNTLIRFRPESGLDARYALQLFVHYLKSGRFRKIAKWTNNIAHLGAKRFADLEFPLCPLPEQQEVVRVLDETFVAVERIEREIDAALEQVRTLRQSTLKLAFSGKLVPQDPHAQPVSVLLDRIRVEREGIAKRTRVRKAGRRKQTKITA